MTELTLPTRCGRIIEATAGEIIQQRAPASVAIREA
jgi:hypothetical protein